MPGERFLTLGDVAEVLNVSASQTYALVRNNELKAIKIGGRGQWRAEREQLENYISRMYNLTEKFIADHPFVETDTIDGATPSNTQTSTPTAVSR
jgi:excisionase family DNA binding protein